MQAANSADAAHKQSLTALSIAAIGVVYGDIGTSPLYTLKEVFNPVHGISTSHENVLGILSLVFWSLLIVVSLKYVVFIMRADNKGEGGIMALIALMQRVVGTDSKMRWPLLILGLFGASLFFGDGIITPAISVLSAVEGLEIATPGLKAFVIPISLGVLGGLFFIQRKGTATVGILFGPIMIVWFLTLAVLGAIKIVAYPSVLQALNPVNAVGFFVEHRVHGFLALGAVVLALTGAEALYADMGHFGKRPIRAAWFLFVLPALLLNYFGQGAMLIHDPATVDSPFYNLAPDWALYPMVGLATLATVIASQAVISGVFSVTRQATQLGFMPRMDIVHTSAREIGQIYVPMMNWTMLAGIVALILGFQTSSNLASAYGIAVTGTMAIDTILAFVVVRGMWKWGWPATLAGMLFFLSVDLSFFSANAIKIFQGGWFPLAIAMLMFTLMTTWKRGRQILAERLQANSIALMPFLAGIAAHPPLRVPGTAVFLTTNLEGVPHAMLHNLVHNKVIHETVILLTVRIRDVPWVPDDERVKVDAVGNEFYLVTVFYGFKDEPDIPLAMEQVKIHEHGFNMLETSFFLSRETLIATEVPGMALWREKLFVSMARNGSSATAFFHIPTNRVIELGTQVEL
ncbi:MAG: potassium transporter Kup [Sulfuriferula sp.]|nr:potassium transporter Kup [Sulfuriferula sp.]